MDKSPWEVLGVPETSSDEAVKLAWRKLILKCHPDKAAEADKEEKAEEFKKVNEAYKTITEPELRRKYEEDKERKKRFEASGAPGPAHGAPPSSTTRHYNTRTAAPSTAYAGSTRDSRSYEYSRSPDDLYEENRTSSRKYNDYDGHYSSSRRDRDRDSPRTPRTFKESSKAAKESDRASRADRRRKDDRAQKSERKFVYVESDSDERGAYEESYHRRSEELRNRDKYAEESSRRYDDRKHRSRSEKYEDSSKLKYASQADEAKDYISRSQHHERPYTVRRTNSAAVPDSYVRRSSARRDRDSERAPRDRRRGSGPEIVDFPTERPIPEFTHSTSSPANIKLRMPGRSSSDYPPEPKSAPSFRRSETMPTTSRTKDKTAPLSNARLRDPVEDSGYSSPTTPDDVKTAYKYAAYSPHPDGVRPLDDKYRTVLREPYEKGSRRKSPSPARTTRGGRYTAASPITPTGRSQSYRVVEPSSSSEDMAQPSLYRTVRHTQPSTFRDVTNNGRNNSDREPLFGEIRGEARSRYDPSKVSYSRKIDVNDINYGYGSRNLEREGHRPSMYRSSTTAY